MTVVVPLIVSLVLFAFSNYVLFISAYPVQKKIAATAVCALLSLAGYHIVSHFIGCSFYHIILLSKNTSFAQQKILESVTIFFACLIPLPFFCFLHSRCIGKQFGVSFFIYVSFMMIEFISLMITGSMIARVLVDFLFFSFWFLLFRKDIEFITTQNDFVDYRFFCFAGFILLVITIGIMVTIPNVIHLFSGRTRAVFTAWIDVTGILIFLLFILLSKSNFDCIRQAIRLRSTTQKDIAVSKNFISEQENVIVSFAEILESKSGQTGNHVRRVSEYCRILAVHLGFSHEEVETIRVAAMMHDIGKLLIPNEILEKKGKLTPAENETMKLHVVYGERMLKNTSGEIMQCARIIAAQHHEWWNGRGYPRHLAGKQINRVSCIVSLADVFDALVSTRSYKGAWTPLDARLEIVNQRGKQFSPECVDAFLLTYPQFLEIIQLYPDKQIVW